MSNQKLSIKDMCQPNYIPGIYLLVLFLDSWWQTNTKFEPLSTLIDDQQWGRWLIT